jgi:hypothetical protein
MGDNKEPPTTLAIGELPDPNTVVHVHANAVIVTANDRYQITTPQITGLKTILEIMHFLKESVKFATIEFRGFLDGEIYRIFSRIRIQELASMIIFCNTVFHVRDLESVTATPVVAYDCNIRGTTREIPVLDYLLKLYDCIFHGLRHGAIRVASIRPEDLRFFFRMLGISPPNAVWMMGPIALQQVTSYAHGLIADITKQSAESSFLMQLIARVCDVIAEEYGDNVRMELERLDRQLRVDPNPPILSD